MTYEDPHRRGVFLKKEKMSVVRCYECGTKLMLTCLCKSCAVKSGRFIENKDD